MKVLMLSDFFLSGQTTHVLELAKQLQVLGTDVHISFGTIHSRLFWSHYTSWLSENRISFSAGEDLLTLISRCRKLRPDLVHSQSSTLFQRAQLLASRFDIPYILTCHGLGLNQIRYRHLLRAAGAVIAIGPNVAAEISELAANVAVIPNGVDTERFVPPTEGRAPRRNIVYIGRLERKRIEPLRHLAAAHEAVTKKPLKVISNWNPGIPGTVFRPWQADLVPHFQSAGIVAACGRTAREALSCGNAVLLMQQAYDGVLSPQLVQKDDFDFSGNLGRYPFSKLQRDLRSLLRSPVRLKKLQNWGRSYAVLNLSSVQMARQTLELYEETLRLSKKPQPANSTKK